jgi:hypothetical protein
MARSIHAFVCGALIIIAALTPLLLLVFDKV